MKAETQFENAVKQAEAGRLTLPAVSGGKGEAIPYFVYQLATHIYHLKLFKAGLKHRHFKPSECKRYYGLSGSIENQIEQLQTILNNYKNKIGYVK